MQLVLLPVLLLVGGWKPATAVGGGYGVGVVWWCWQPLLDREGEGSERERREERRGWRQASSEVRSDFFFF